MIQLILRYFLFFFAGVVIHMGLMHHFSYDRVKTHPMIRIWRSPIMAAAIWGIILFAIALLILLLQHFQLGLNLDTLFVFLGYSFWAILAALFSNQFHNKENKD
jgi:hypothetical protein